MQTSDKSTLKVWWPTRYHLETAEGAFDMYEVKCATCGGVAWVRGSWLRPRDAHNGASKTRPCTYCFVAAWLPQFAERSTMPDPPEGWQPLPQLEAKPKPRRRVKTRAKRRT